MITIIAGTNRENSITDRFTRVYKRMLEEAGEEVKYLSLIHLPAETLLTDVYDHKKKPAIIQQLQDEYFTNSGKFVFIFPEYNGSVPGVLKLLIDNLDPRVAFQHKKASLIGISTGRAGNLRGLDHMASILHHMKVTVLPNLLPISRVHLELDENNQLNESTLKVVKEHLSATIAL
ncbi:MAG: NADPH-dependent FMN reductase [Bacteroidia bacterium]